MRPLALIALLLALLPLGCGDDDSDDQEPAREPAATTEDGCRQVEQPAPQRGEKRKRPRGRLAKGLTYEVVFQTSCGSFTVRLDQRTSPSTAASFVALAKSGFFDDTVFHRIVPDFVIQGGDPTASGSGGPGYSTRDVPPRGAAYTNGVVAMAKGETEPRGTAGSQFYVVTADDAGLPPDYAILGKVTEGLDVVDRIGALGDPASGEAGTPLRVVTIGKATVKESG